VHKPTHESRDATDTASNIKREEEIAQDVPTQSVKHEQAVPTSNPYLALQQHPQFQPLFLKYPKLKSQLRRVHNASQQPDQPTVNSKGGFVRRSRQSDRMQGQWTQEKADELAMKILMDLQKQDEGVKEFMLLVSEVFQRGQRAQSRVG
jgi:hypothetical protein